MKAFRILIVLLAGTLLLCACEMDGSGTSEGRLQVLATVSPITNIVYNVSGDHGDLAGLVSGPDTSVQQ